MPEKWFDRSFNADVQRQEVDGVPSVFIKQQSLRKKMVTKANIKRV
jgi:hypothetical protein